MYIHIPSFHPKLNCGCETAVEAVLEVFVVFWSPVSIFSRILFPEASTVFHLSVCLSLSLSLSASWIMYGDFISIQA